MYDKKGAAATTVHFILKSLNPRLSLFLILRAFWRDLVSDNHIVKTYLISDIFLHLISDIINQ